MIGCSEDATVIAEEAVKFVDLYDRLNEKHKDLPKLVSAVEDHMEQLRTAIRIPSSK